MLCARRSSQSKRNANETDLSMRLRWRPNRHANDPENLASSRVVVAVHGERLEIRIVRSPSVGVRLPWRFALFAIDYRLRQRPRFRPACSMLWLLFSSFMRPLNSAVSIRTALG
jgi:hypothetical protein